MTHAPVSKKKNDENSEVIAPPDGGWGWMVVFASFAIHIVTDGVTYTFGIFFLEFVKKFKTGNAETSWIASILVGVTLCSGPFSSAFVNKYGCRAVTIAGCIIAGISLILSVFAENIYYLYVTIGLGTGFGFGMIYLPAIVCVTIYFEKLRSLATGIAVCGSGFGTLIFAPIITILIEKFKWQGALLVIAGIVFCCSVFGAMFRPLKAPKKPEIVEEKYEPLLTKKPNQYQVSDVQFKVEETGNGNGQMHRSKSIGCDVDKNGVANGNGHKKSSSHLEVENNTNRLTSSQPHLSDLDQPDKLKRNSKSDSSGQLDRIDVFYTGSLHNIPKNRSKVSLAAIAENQELQVTEPHSLNKMMSFTLFKDPIFIIFVLSNFLTSIGFNVPYVYITAQAETLGIETSRANNLLSIIGFANTVGRIILGYVSDKPFVNRLLIYNLCLTICGVSTAMATLCPDFFTLGVYTFVFGFTIGAYVGLTSVILVDLLGLENLTNAFGLLLLFQGVASFIGPPIAGFLFDVTKSYTPGFLVAGFTLAFSGVILFSIPPLQRYLAKKEAKQAGLVMVPL